MDRFWNKVNKTESCWLWTGAKKGKGYGHLQIDNRFVGAHRYSFFLANGYYPEVVMHSCDTPACVNPDHLVAGTTKLNNLDRVSKGRGVYWQSNKTECLRGHPLSGNNLYVEKDGHRGCKTCRSMRRKKYRAMK